MNVSAMPFGFQETSLLVRSSNGRDDILEEPLHFKSRDGRLYRVPAKATTDGMSSPGIVRGIPGFEPYGKHWFPAVLHDAPYRGTLEVYRYMQFIPANLTRGEADALIAEALESQGVGPIRRGIIYSALRIFGAPNFKGNPP